LTTARQSLFRASARNPALYPASREQLLDAYRSYLNQMKAKLPELFATLPKAGLIVEATPTYTERQRPSATYEPAPLTELDPGVSWSTPTTSPGFHWAMSSRLRITRGFPAIICSFPSHRKESICRTFECIANTRPTPEGGGLYAEQLGKEVGFYQDPHSDYGRLQSDMLRAIRLVVDTGLHSKHWTRQQVVDYFHEHSSLAACGCEACM
jgi:uncharacterized protein (DUF885 family)